jgi:hypothetical protein
MKIGRKEYFCSCLSKDVVGRSSCTSEHVVAVDKTGRCVYCSYIAVLRPVNEFDIRFNTKYEEALEKEKYKHLEVIIKDKMHNEKVN